MITGNITRQQSLWTFSPSRPTERLGLLTEPGSPRTLSLRLLADQQSPQTFSQSRPTERSGLLTEPGSLETLVLRRGTSLLRRQMEDQRKGTCQARPRNQAELR